MSSDFALDKLSRLNETVAEEDRTPELRLLLAFADCSRQAEERLRAVGALRAQGVPPAKLLQQPEAFQARHFTGAVAGCRAGQHDCTRRALAPPHARTAPGGSWPPRLGRSGPSLLWRRTWTLMRAVVHEFHIADKTGPQGLAMHSIPRLADPTPTPRAGAGPVCPLSGAGC